GLERRVRKLEKNHRSRTHKLKRLYKVGLTARVISSFDDEALDKEDTSKQGRIDEIDADKDITLVCTHDAKLQDEGIKDVSEEEVVEVVTTAKMLIDIVVDVAQVTTAIHDVLVKDMLEKKSAQKEQEANDALINTWNDIQAKINADAQLAQRLHEEEQL
nr:hypothetical protein [Tanacetum cinerariifolium]